MTWSKLPPGKEPKPQAGQLSPPQAEGPSPRPDLGTIARRAREAPGALTPRDITVLQRTIGNRATCQLLQAARRDKSTTGTPGAAGLPDGLRAGVERLSGLPMGDVRVHYHSPEPARVAAVAYARGGEIHVAPGAEGHLPHEAWHVAQQKQGRVRPTVQVGGQPVNEDPSLEREADRMGEAARRGAGAEPAAIPGGSPAPAVPGGGVAQRRFLDADAREREALNWNRTSALIEGFKASSHRKRLERARGIAAEEIEAALDELAVGDAHDVTVSLRRGLLDDDNYESIARRIIDITQAGERQGGAAGGEGGTRQGGAPKGGEQAQKDGGTSGGGTTEAGESAQAHASPRSDAGPLKALSFSEGSAIDQSKKEGSPLPQLVKLVSEYNNLLPAAAQYKAMHPNEPPDPAIVGYMDEIVTCSASYLLDRPPNLRSTASDTKGKGKARVKEIGSLINTIDVHANFFGIKFLEGVFGEERNYKLERFVHGKNPNAGRPIKEDLDFRYYDWNHRNEKISFESFNKAIERAENLVEDGKDIESENDPNKEKRLKYFSKEQRTAHEASFEGKSLKQGGAPVHTEGGSASAYSGFSNVWIYVCSALTRQIYTAPGEDDVLHHSSFLQGEPVIAAGDWLVGDGAVIYINCYSGHYKPNIDEMRLFAATFQSHWGSNTLIQPKYKGPVYLIGDFISRGKDASAAPEHVLERLTSTLGGDFFAPEG